MALNKLAHLSLVNKVTSELENHIGIADKTLSEFVIDLAEKHADARSFQKALDEVGAELSFDLVRNLLEMIQRMRPKTGGGADGFPSDPQDGEGITFAQRRLLMESLEVVLDVFDEPEIQDPSTFIACYGCTYLAGPPPTTIS